MIIIIFMWAVMPVTSPKPPSIFSTKDREHLATDEASLVFKHLKDFKQCHIVYVRLVVSIFSIMLHQL